jgi:two-component system, NtrC family, nitrogen regulation sensor histidine kinase NtrY
MNRLRNRLIAVFLGATLPALAVTIWITSALLERSLDYSSTAQVDSLSRTLEQTARQYYQREREALRREAAANPGAGRLFVAGALPDAPAAVRDFHSSSDQERFVVTGDEGDTLLYLGREDGGVRVHERHLGGIRLDELQRQYAEAREAIDRRGERDLRRGFLWALALLAGVPWAIALLIVILAAHRISKPIQQLAGALRRLGAGDLSVRIATQRSDEVGEAMQAFDHTAAELQQSRERLLYLARLESWQALARKMAHEVKNSLTPIRLTMEEWLARQVGEDDTFRQQAAQIVADEVNSLERRVRAFSELATEPPLDRRELDAAALIEERIGFLRPAHPEVEYRFTAPAQPLKVHADEDLVKAILTNLLENAAQAAGAMGTVKAAAARCNGKVAIDIEDSGPGLSEPARRTLFEPTISFKKGGMGLGLSIAKKSALLCGGDILPTKGELGGAAFRVLLPASCPENES